MVIDNWRGYRESADLSKIPAEYLAYPSRNVLVKKGKVVTRGGLVNDGVAATSDSPIHSEWYWKEAAGGARFIRAFGSTLQVKHNEKWVTFYTGLDANTSRVFFASWIDGNGSVIKSRLIFCDGTSAIYSWNGFIGTVDSFSTPTITFDADQANLGLMGLDDGSGTTQTVTVYSLDGNGDVDASEEETYSVDPTGGLTLTLDAAPSGFTVAADDIVIAKPVKFADAIDANYLIDVVFPYKNHIVTGSYNSVEMFFSHVEDYSFTTGLNFTQPVAASRTAITAIYLRLDAKFTAMGARKGTLWVSDADDWYKVTKTETINAYDLWVDVEKFENADAKGALPMAISKHKDDLIYLAQDRTLQRVTTVEVIGKDDIELLSDDVEDMFQRFDLTDVRLKYTDRAIYIILPTEGVLLILDTAEQQWYFQPPQDIPINCMTVVGNVKYGHHNARNETYILFSGRKDLDADRASAVIAIGYQKDGHHFRYKTHGNIGIDCRLTKPTEVLWERYFEEDGAKAIGSDTFVGKNVKLFNSDVDASWASLPYASVPFGGVASSNDLYRSFVYSRDRVDGYFETRPIITISGTQSEFHLLGLWWEDKASARKIGDDHYLPS